MLYWLFPPFLSNTTFYSGRSEFGEYRDRPSDGLVCCTNFLFYCWRLSFSYFKSLILKFPSTFLSTIALRKDIRLSGKLQYKTLYLMWSREFPSKSLGNRSTLLASSRANIFDLVLELYDMQCHGGILLDRTSQAHAISGCPSYSYKSSPQGHWHGHQGQG
jgi:hypothetical protein